MILCKWPGCPTEIGEVAAIKGFCRSRRSIESRDPGAYEAAMRPKIDHQAVAIVKWKEERARPISGAYSGVLQGQPEARHHVRGMG